MKKVCIVIAVLLLCLGLTGCITVNVQEKNSAAAPTPTETAAETEAPETASAEAEATPSEAAAPVTQAAAPAEITPVQTTIDAPAKIGEWVETKRYSAEDSDYHTVYYRVTNVARGDEAKKAVDAYNAEDHAVVIGEVEGELEYGLIEYEVYFPEDFPQADYGITSIDINFSVTSPDGGGIKANGMSYIGLSSVWDISKAPEINEFYAGQTFTEGKAVFAMVKGVTDYVFEVSYYLDDEEYVSYVEGA